MIKLKQIWLLLKISGLNTIMSLEKDTILYPII